jgi:hypothetical protein
MKSAGGRWIPSKSGKTGAFWATFWATFLTQPGKFATDICNEFLNRSDMSKSSRIK